MRTPLVHQTGEDKRRWKEINAFPDRYTSVHNNNRSPPPPPFPRPLQKSLRVNILYHKGQRQVATFCLRCLTQGHHVSVCTNDTVCRECKQRNQRKKKKKNTVTQITTHMGPARVGSQKGETKKTVDRPKKDDTVRTSVRQTTLRSTLDLHTTRSRSETRKRWRSGEETSHTRCKCRSRRGVTTGQTCVTLHPHSQTTTDAECNSQAWG